MEKQKTKAVTLSLTEQEEKDLIKVSKEFSALQIKAEWFDIG